MTPIATYETSHRGVRHRFELSEGSINVTKWIKGAEYTVTVPLGQLRTHPEGVHMVPGLYAAGCLMLVASVVVLMGFVVFVMVADYRGPVAGLLALMGLVGALGLGLTLVSKRHARDYRRFRSDAGVVLLGIPCDIERPVDFERFIRLLVEQIRKARGES
jgi:hypothetical protein